MSRNNSIPVKRCARAFASDASSDSKFIPPPRHRPDRPFGVCVCVCPVLWSIRFVVELALLSPRSIKYVIIIILRTYTISQKKYPRKRKCFPRTWAGDASAVDGRRRRRRRCLKSPKFTYTRCNRTRKIFTLLFVFFPPFPLCSGRHGSRRRRRRRQRCPKLDSSTTILCGGKGI